MVILRISLNNDNIKIYNKNCLDLMKTIPDHSIDLIVTDPPYDLHVGIEGGSCASHCGRSERFKNENVEKIKDFGDGYDIVKFRKRICPHNEEYQHLHLVQQETDSRLFQFLRE